MAPTTISIQTKEPPSMETEPISSFQFPPGFRFHPSDEELIIHYLLNKVNSRLLPASIIAEMELNNYTPWGLPSLFSTVHSSQNSSFGYCKATGTDKPILTAYGCKKIGMRKALVFYTGRPPKGVKTDWL
ncbi:NAC domain containing protein 6 [Actinidia rufa]|uniref:NAC domain containing protein 6 n=1 Tax=Actinidia rufa TaxID=165716 RepID=A0A7J0GQU9_9ERIC|nr:NAC domain containing protein 6 [Actinidia rufa]